MDDIRNSQLNVLKLNLEIFKLKKIIEDKNLTKSIKDELNDYLFILDENQDYQLNNSLIRYNFSKYFVLNIITSYFKEIDEIKHLEDFKKNLNDKIQEVFYQMECPDLNQSSIFKKSNNEVISDFVFNEESIDRIISEIPINNFHCTDDNGDLIAELKEIINIPIFKFISGGLEDIEVSKLLYKIEMDIESKNISGEITELLDFYFEEYNVIKRQMELNHFLNEYINTRSFSLFSSDYDDEIIIYVIMKVKEDISNDNTMDKNKIVLKLKDYLNKEQIKINLLAQLKVFEVKITGISKICNLTIDEVKDIFKLVKIDIINYQVHDSLKNHLKSKLNEKIELNKSDSRIKLNNVIKSDKIREELSFDESDLDKVTEEIGDLIYNNNIRSYEITEELIIGKLRRVVNGVY